MSDNSNLYPLLFKPIEKHRIWGAESWILSGLEDDASEVANGFLEGNTINELLEIYLMDLIGTEAYNKCGAEFPLLIKILTVNDFLSVQVHPDDEMAAERHNAYGKTETWFIMDAKPDAMLYLGFNRDITPHEFMLRSQNGTLAEVMNSIHPQKGECYYLPAGLVHACGGGLTIAEVQQVSDISYRIYDWGRENDPKTARQMHIELALDCIDFNAFDPIPTTTGKLAECPYFTVNYNEISNPVDCEGMEHDGFIVYMNIEGTLEVLCDKKKTLLKPGECLLIPDALVDWTLLPQGTVKLLEVTL